MVKPAKSISNIEYPEEVSAKERIKRKKAKESDSKATKTNAKEGGGGSRKPKKKPIKRLREQRRQQSAHAAALAEKEERRRKSRKVDAGIDHPGNIVAAALEDNVETSADQAEISDFYWEVETVVGRRIHKGRVEYLIRWKGCGEEENTWEPAANLCDTAMEEAMRYVKAQKLKDKQREEDEKKLFGDGGEGAADDVVHEMKEGEGNVSKDTKEVLDDEEILEEEEIEEDDLWDWTDQDQVVFHPVQRIDVNDPEACAAVKEARINGTPVVLVGHVGWANFAKRWISKKEDAGAMEGGGDGAAGVKSTGAIENARGDVEMADAVPSTDGNSDVGEKSSSGEDEIKPEMQTNGDSSAAAAPPTEPNAVVVQIPMSAAALLDDAQMRNSFNTTNNEDGTKPSEVNTASIADAKASQEEYDDAPLDLSKRDYYLDINKMIADIGEEDVPVIKRNYNEEKPIHGNIHAAKFLTNCWPNEDSDAEAAKNQKTSPKLYLHQWQFPLSDTAGRKLCHQNNPLPKSILGEDLLKYWLDLPQCKLDSPLQYIFMGREDTLSKLHNDPGGLDISIAPIVGEKECVLVHRSDGSNCLYHLQASLNEIDLHKFPLLSQARIWRTTIQPGEILLMPHGTYHQCRNVTPCLSYSRFHLDTVNLLPFAQSLVNGDAPEIDHEEILWNLTSELISKVDKAFDATQSRVKQRLDTDEDLSDDVVETVNILRMLRHFVREVARRHEIRQQLKGGDSKSDHCFSTLVDDVDMCLHEFRFRKMRSIPPFKARQGKALQNTISKGGRKDVIGTDLSKFEVEGKPVVAFNTVLEVNYMSLRGADVDKLYPRAEKAKTGEKLIKDLSVGDWVNVKLEQKVVKAEVLEVVSQMHSAYLSFEDYPSVYDEWQPVGLLRHPTRAEISPGDVKPGLVVIDLSNSNEYRAKVMSTMNGPMAKMRLIVSQHTMTRFISPDMILGKYEPPKKQIKQPKKQYVAEMVEVETEMGPAPPCRPKTGQVVEVHRKGAAWVTKCHYENEPVNEEEAFPTHVDVRYIVGQSSEEKMVPIGLVRLAPELDPDSGRTQRRTAGCKGTYGSAISVDSDST